MQQETQKDCELKKFKPTQSALFMVIFPRELKISFCASFEV